MVYGLELRPLPDGYVPLEAEVVVKRLDEQGRVTLLTRSTDGLFVWDSVGMLQCSLDIALATARRGFERDED